MERPANATRQGCQTVAGGRNGVETSGTASKKPIAPREGCQKKIGHRNREMRKYAKKVKGRTLEFGPARLICLRLSTGSWFFIWNPLREAWIIFVYLPEVSLR